MRGRPRKRTLTEPQRRIICELEEAGAEDHFVLAGVSQIALKLYVTELCGLIRLGLIEGYRYEVVDGSGHYWPVSQEQAEVLLVEASGSADVASFSAALVAGGIEGFMLTMDGKAFLTA